MTRIHSAIIAVSLGLLVGTAAAQAPAPDANEPAVTLTASPTDLSTNGAVKLSGMAYPEPGVQVRLTITPPSGSPSVLVATPDNAGRYSVFYSRTSAEGTYKVSAQTNKTAPAVAQFTVKTYLIDIDEDVADNKSLLEQPAELVRGVKRQVDGVPESPAKQEMETKLEQLDAAVKPLAEQSAKLTKALAPFRTMITQRGDATESLQPLFDHLAQLDEQARKSKEQFAKEVARSQKTLTSCDAIDQATQALRAVPEMIGIAKKPWEFAAAFATNMAKSELPAAAGPGAQAVGSLVGKLPGAAGSPNESLAENELEMGSETEIAEKLVARIPPSVRETPGYAFVVAETKKFVPGIVDGTKSPIDMLDKATTLAGDVIAYANERLFAQYCEKFEGSFTATMLAHFYSKPNGEGQITEWWTYSTAIKGKIVLRYPKSATGTAVALSGQLEGGATRFTYKSNVFTTDLYGSMAKGGIVRTKDVAPAATDDASGGMMNAVTSPTSFYIPVTGQLTPGKLTIAMGDARTDFNETYTRGHTFYVVIAPTTLMLPVLGHFTLPYTNARFILNHVVNGDFAVVQRGKAMTIEKLDRQERPANQNLAVYTINLKACNPGCS